MSALLMVAIAIAIGIALAAAGQPPQGESCDKLRTRYRSIPCEFADGCRALSGTVCMPFGPPGSDEQTAPSHVNREMQPQGLAGRGGVTPGDVGLLHQRMRVLQIDPDEFARANPAIMSQLTICCVQCGSTAECKRDLSDAWTDLSGEAWRDYCPNAARLRMISALRVVGISSLSDVEVARPFAGDASIARGH